MNKLYQNCKEVNIHHTLSNNLNKASKPIIDLLVKPWSNMRPSTGVSPSGKAMDSDSIMRRFESYHPSQSQSPEFCNIITGKNIDTKSDNH